MYCQAYWSIFSILLGGKPMRTDPRRVPMDLTIRLGCDVGAAALTAFAVAPLIAAFDEAITRSAAGESLWGSLGVRLGSILGMPAEFFSSAAFIWMWIVYAATYATTNSLKSIEAVFGVRLGFLATLCVTVVNMSCGIAKDAAFAQLFGSKGGKDGAQKTPTSAYVTWFLRDLLAFTFILTLPPIISQLAQIYHCPVVVKELLDCLSHLENAKKKTQGFFTMVWNAYVNCMQA